MKSIILEGSIKETNDNIYIIVSDMNSFLHLSEDEIIHGFVYKRNSSEAKSSTIRKRDFVCNKIIL